MAGMDAFNDDYKEKPVTSVKQPLKNVHNQIPTGDKPRKLNAKQLEDKQKQDEMFNESVLDGLAEANRQAFMEPVESDLTDEEKEQIVNPLIVLKNLITKKGAQYTADEVTKTFRKSYDLSEYIEKKAAALVHLRNSGDKAQQVHIDMDGKLIGIRYDAKSKPLEIQVVYKLGDFLKMNVADLLKNSITEYKWSEDIYTVHVNNAAIEQEIKEIVAKNKETREAADRKNKKRTEVAYFAIKDSNKKIKITYTYKIPGDYFCYTKKQYCLEKKCLMANCKKQIGSPAAVVNYEALVVKCKAEAKEEAVVEYKRKILQEKNRKGGTK